MLPRAATHLENPTAQPAECAEHYRELAITALVRCEKAGTADARMHYVLLAAHWYERALKCERDSDVSDRRRPTQS
jgi:hypothetical protein